MSDTSSPVSPTDGLAVPPLPDVVSSPSPPSTIKKSEMPWLAKKSVLITPEGSVVEARMISWASDDTYVFRWDGRSDIPDQVLDDYADIHGEDDLLVSINERAKEKKCADDNGTQSLAEFVWSSDDDKPPDEVSSQCSCGIVVW